MADQTCKPSVITQALGIQATGPRTVIVPADPIIWDEGTSYEYLTLVASTDFGQGYLSKKDVPAGTPLTNTEYWIPVAQFNAQLAQLQQQIGQMNGTFNAQLAQLQRQIGQMNGTISSIQDDVSKNEGDIEALSQKGNQSILYGVCHNSNNPQEWLYVASTDMKSVGCMGNLPSKGTKYDYSDASNLFERNGILYYPQDSHSDIYATTDGETWNEGYGTGFPSPLDPKWLQWAPMLFEDASGNVKMAIARQYNDSTLTNAIGSTTHNFRIDVFDCTVADDGKITIGSGYTTVLGTGSHIDPYIVYDPQYGYVMACKNESTCLIEVYQGASLSNMSLAVTTRLVGCEAPKLISGDGSLTLYYEGYSLYTGSGKTAGNSIPVHLYFTTVLSAGGSKLSYGGLSVMNAPSFYRHITFIQNSEVLAKYAKNHPIVPFTTDASNRIVQIHLASGANDIYPVTLPFPLMFTIEGAARTVTVHDATNALGSGCVGYIQIGTDNAIALKNKYATCKPVDGETIPCFVADTMYFRNDGEE